MEFIGRLDNEVDGYYAHPATLRQEPIRDRADSRLQPFTMRGGSP
jgi:hypothetical protein